MKFLMRLVVFIIISFVLVEQAAAPPPPPTVPLGSNLIFDVSNALAILMIMGFGLWWLRKKRINPGGLRDKRRPTANEQA